MNIVEYQLAEYIPTVLDFIIDHDIKRMPYPDSFKVVMQDHGLWKFDPCTVQYISVNRHGFVLWEQIKLVGESLRSDVDWYYSTKQYSTFGADCCLAHCAYHETDTEIYLRIVAFYTEAYQWIVNHEHT